MFRCLFIFLFGLCCAVQGSFIEMRGKAPGINDSRFYESKYRAFWRKIRLDRPPDSTRIHLIFYRAAQERLLGVRLPEWGGGGAIGADTVIIPIDRIPLLDMDISRIALHELVHIVITRAYGRVKVPRWFHEGVAMFLSGELSSEEQVVLSKGVLFNRILPLDTIDEVNRFSRRIADLAYAQSHATVLFLVNSYGVDIAAELLKTADSTKSFDNALRQSIGLTTKELERLVRVSLNEKYRYVFLWDNYLLWTGVSLLFIAATISVYIRNRRKRKQMELEEEELSAEDPGDIAETDQERPRIV